MAKEMLMNFSGHCVVNDCPQSFSVTYVEREDGMWERRDPRDCNFRGLINPRGCKDCEILKQVKQVVTREELNGEPVEEYHLYDKLAKLNGQGQ